MIRELAVDDHVRQYRVRGRDARADGERVQEREVRDKRPYEEGADEPHGGHDGAEEEGKGPPLLFEVARGELHAGEDELHTKNQARKVEDVGVEVCLGAAVGPG